MAFHHSILEMAFFIAPAIGVALSADEQADLTAMQSILQRRKAELKLCGRNRSFASRIKTLQADILRIETAIDDLRTLARYRRGV